MAFRNFSVFKSSFTESEKDEEMSNLTKSNTDEKSPKGSLMIPAEAEIIKGKNPEGTSMFRSINHVMINEDVFAGDPSIHDIKQGGFTGDCYLLAALAAIVALPDGNKIIRSMIKDMGDHVIVRFFDDYRKPHFLAVEKSVPTNFGILSSGALWVKLIEKAYAMFRGGKYSVLDKGHTEKVIEALTGATNYSNFEGYCSFPVQARSPLSTMNTYIDGNGIYAFHELMRLSDQTPKNIQERIYELVFNKDKQLFNLWKAWIKNKRVAWKEVITHQHPVCLHHFTEFLKQHPVEVEVESAVKQVKDWVTNNHILPGPKFSHHYSYDALELFVNLKKRLENNYPVSVSSGEKVEQPDGIIPLHAYAVVGVEDNAETRRKYVLVRNPYGEDRPFLSKLLLKGSRSSIDVKSKHDETGWEVKVQTSNSSTSRMELSDFCEAFQYIDAMDCVSVEAINKRVEKHYQDKPEQRLN